MHTMEIKDGRWLGSTWRYVRFEERRAQAMVAQTHLHLLQLLPYCLCICGSAKEVEQLYM